MIVEPQSEVSDSARHGMDGFPHARTRGFFHGGNQVAQLFPGHREVAARCKENDAVQHCIGHLDVQDLETFVSQELDVRRRHGYAVLIKPPGADAEEGIDVFSPIGDMQVRGQFAPLDQLLQSLDMGVDFLGTQFAQELLERTAQLGKVCVKSALKLLPNPVFERDSVLVFKVDIAQQS